MKKTIIFIFIIFPTILFAQDKPTSLNEIIEKVISDFPSVIQNKYTIEAIKAKAEGTKTWMNPTFNAGFTRVPYDFSILGNRNSSMNQAGFTFNVQQMIPNFKNQNANQKYILSLVDIEKCNIEKQKNELRLSVKQLYFNRLIAEKKIIEIEKSEDILHLLIETETAKLEYNKSDLLNIYKTKAKLAEYKNMKLMLQGMINESNAGLNTLLQRDVSTKFYIDTTFALFKYDIVAKVENTTSRSDIEAMGSMIKSMKLEQNAVKLKLRPEFGIMAEHMQMLAMPSQWAIMGMMTLPIKSFSDKMVKSEIKSMDYKIKSMEEEKNAMKIMIDKMTNEKLEILKSRYLMYKNFIDEIIPQYEKNYEVSLYYYRQNSTDFTKVTDAIEMLYMKKTEMLDLLNEILITEAEYEYEKEIK